MPELHQLARPVMSRCARLHADQAVRQLLEKLDHLAASKLALDDDLPSSIDAMHLEHALSEIQADRGNLHVDGSLSDSCQRSPYGTSRPGAGAVHLINFPCRMTIAE